MADDNRHDLKDPEWALLEPLLPDRTPRRGGRWSDHRLIVDAVRWRTRTGCPWRDLPERFGPWQTAYSRHRRWSADGTWAAVLEHLRTEADTDPAALDEAGAWQVAVDSTAVRAHADAAGARHEPPKDVPAQLLEDLAAAVPAGPARSTTKSSARSSGSPPPGPRFSPAGASSPATRPDGQATPTGSDEVQVDDRAGDGGEGGGAAGGEHSAA